ncbi:copper resistance protein CopC [Sporosarcina newyorkensis 2681]|uniref:Copper resistance protein CopC n=1 Tax=Sporosarcina newyorkensis 2681 TaxID=1027292 RepID=F9DY56_9BACL|nr:copper resistance protein CopC [Sporosarcina newyorkensis]EGQ19269.1 copper resistance protein CopC [Sporosarcina newyorkensis 2681]
MKKIISATLILLFVFSSTVSAHTGLTNSSPAEGEEVVEDVHEVVLEFNTKIETMSTIKVFNENDEEIIIGNIQFSDNKMTGAFMSPLDNGIYKVDWKIIGADGHPIQGSYSFVVSQAEIVAPNASEESTDIPATPTEEPVEKPLEKPVEQPVEVPSKIASNDVLVIILVVLFSIAGGFIGWVIGRRRK